MSCVNYVQDSQVLPNLHTAGNETIEQVYKCRDKQNCSNTSETCGASPTLSQTLKGQFLIHNLMYMYKEYLVGYIISLHLTAYCVLELLS